ncbi:hypothetical protein EJ110_NYTH16070 [Nymphaea thermarum]|nr:hypothetical protein EJ110_NYTH16070 [Nymphaea thermarum]
MKKADECSSIVGMEFETEYKTYSFYNSYAFQLRFSVNKCISEKKDIRRGCKKVKLCAQIGIGKFFEWKILHLPITNEHNHPLTPPCMSCILRSYHKWLTSHSQIRAG